MAWGRRCTMGCESWPDSNDYQRCPICLEETVRYANLFPLPADEARSMVNHMTFDVYYHERCEKIGLPPDGPLPWRAGDPQLAEYGLEPA